MFHSVKHVLSGLLMGLAGLFPGVSAGTVALILGIHGRLIRAMASVYPALPFDLFRAPRDPDARHRVAAVDLWFIVATVAGMLTTTFVGARGVTWLTTNHAGPVMAAFLGLIAVGASVPWRRIENQGGREVAFLVPGVALALVLAFLPAGSLGTGVARFFLGGLVAMPMMILPGVSGSAMLITLGLYEDAIAAAGEFDFVVLSVFATGGLIGLLGTAKGIKWLLDHHHGPTMAVLTGLLAGSMLRVWPWRTEPGFAAGLPAAPNHDLTWLLWTVLAGAVVIAIDVGGRRLAKAAQQGLDDEP